MLHEETVGEATLALIRKLSADSQLKDFVLVGGTALALQLGHRKSIDIDLLSAKVADPLSIGRHLESVYAAKEIAVLQNAVFSYIEGVKTDMVSLPYQWVRPLRETEGIRMASLEDLAATKFNAIVESGRRLKDYVDIHCLLEHGNLDYWLGAYAERYLERNAGMARNVLLYHKEIKFDAELHLLGRAFNWGEMAERFREAVAEPKRVFGMKQGPSIDLSDKQQDAGQHLGKGRRR